GGPAASAGLQKNDVVVSFEGTTIDDYQQLHRLSADAEVGKTVKLEIVRNRERRTINLRIAEAPDRLTPERPPSPQDRSLRVRRERVPSPTPRRGDSRAQGESDGPEVGLRQTNSKSSES